MRVRSACADRPGDRGMPTPGRGASEQECGCPSGRAGGAWPHDAPRYEPGDRRAPAGRPSATRTQLRHRHPDRLDDAVRAPATCSTISQRGTTAPPTTRLRCLSTATNARRRRPSCCAVCTPSGPTPHPRAWSIRTPRAAALADGGVACRERSSQVLGGGEDLVRGVHARRPAGRAAGEWPRQARPPGSTTRTPGTN